MSSIQVEFHQRLDANFRLIRKWLGQLPIATFASLAAAVSLFLSLLTLTPRLFILLGDPMAGTFEWDRGMLFIAQVQDPFHAIVEPALRWRIAPALLGHVLHLSGYASLIVPWLGLIMALVYATILSEARLQDRLDAMLLVTLLGTLASVQSITMAHGINDGWLLLTMLITAFSQNRWLRLVAAFFGPWVDERYLLSLPVNAACRLIFPSTPSCHTNWKTLGLEMAGILPYLVIRVGATLIVGDHTSSSFILQALGLTPLYLPNAPLGWWFGQRAGWVLVVFAYLAAWRVSGRGAGQWLLLATIAGFGSITLLAADLTRSTNFFFALTCAGAFASHHVIGAAHRTKLLLSLTALNHVLPFAMMTYIWIVPIHSLPFELLRIYKNW